MDWRDRSQMVDDVVFFPYVTGGIERAMDEVFVWDLDKTYLDTKIDSIGGIFTAAVERAMAKKNVPGTSTMLGRFSKRWTEQHGQLRFPIFFITASPPQMEERILEKFTHDGIRPLGCFYKDNLRNLSPKRWWRLTKQVGFKLQSLLQLRTRLRDDVRQVLWGDDSESDAIIYNLYSDICSRRIGTNDLRSILKHYAVTGEQVDRILILQSQIPETDPVEKIYINLAVDTDPDYYLKFGRRTVPTSETFQVTLDLFQDHRLTFEDVYAVAQDMIFNYGYTPEELVRSFDELVRRRVLGEIAATHLIQEFKTKGLMHSSFEPSVMPAKELRVENSRVYELQGQSEPWVPGRIDYIHDYR